MPILQPLKKIREDAGLSLAVVCRNLDINENDFSQFENGNSNLPEEVIQKIKNFYVRLINLFAPIEFESYDIIQGVIDIPTQITDKKTNLIYEMIDCKDEIDKLKHQKKCIKKKLKIAKIQLVLKENEMKSWRSPKQKKP